MKRILILVLALAWAQSAGATATNGYRVVSSVNIGTDSSWVADSAVLYSARDFANDTLYRVIKLTKPDTTRGVAKFAGDTVVYRRMGVWVPGNELVGGYNPAFSVTWFMRIRGTTTKQQLYDDNPQVTATVVNTDSIQENVTTTLPDSLLQVVNRTRRIASALGVQDSIAVRYIDDDGTNANGLTWGTAWTGFDSVKSLTTPTVIYVGAGTYNNVVCSIRTSGIYIRGAGSGVSHVRGVALGTNPDSTSGHKNRVFHVGDSAATYNIYGGAISGLSIGHQVSYSTISSPWDPAFQCAIWLYDKVRYFTVEDNFFIPDSNYKAVVSGTGKKTASGVASNSYGNVVRGNRFIRPRTSAIDWAGSYGVITGNYIEDIRDEVGAAYDTGAGTMWPIQIVSGGRSNIVADNYINNGNRMLVATGLNTINNLFANNYLGTQFAYPTNRPMVEITSAANNAFTANWFRTSIGTSFPMTQTEWVRDSVAATATIDYDTLAAIVDDSLTASHGAGLWTSAAGGSGDFPETLFVYDSAGTALVQGATLHVKAADTGSYQNSSGPQATNASGYAIFSLDAGTFPVAVSAQGYFQATAYQLVTQASPGGRDTVWVYSVNVTIPAGADSCNVVIFADKAYFKAEFDPTSKQVLDTSGIFLNVQKFTVTDADGDKVIQQTLPRTAATTGSKLKWNIVVTGPGGNKIGEHKDYTVPNQSADTLGLP